MFESLLSKNKYKNITPAQAKTRLESPDVLLLDVRTPPEYADIHIPKSISLPLDLLKTKIQKISPDKDAEIIVYCQSGMRAATACSQLAALGYTNVSCMGGITAWNYQVERGNI
jgi:rhodanese-related sulfurtransferase